MGALTFGQMAVRNPVDTGKMKANQADLGSNSSRITSEFASSLADSTAATAQISAMQAEAGIQNMVTQMKLQNTMAQINMALEGNKAVNKIATNGAKGASELVG